MKKFYYNDGIETNAFYTELPDCFGCEYIICTCGEPLTSESFDSRDEEQKVIADAKASATSDVMDADADDMEYVMDLADAWGILPESDEDKKR